MTTTHHTSKEARTRLPLAAKLVTLAITLVGVAAISASFSAPTVEADTIGPAPQLALNWGCVATEFHYVATMTNTGLGTTHFDISVNYGSGATVHAYDVVSGAKVVATFDVEQSGYGIFDVSNVDDATIIDHQMLTADCRADPYTEIGLVCLHDDSTPSVYLEWVNLSATHAAVFDVYFNGSIVGGGSSKGNWNPHFLSFDVVDGQHVMASIFADGVLLDELIADVDCPPTTEVTAPPTPQPDATLPSTTLVEPPLPVMASPQTTVSAVDPATTSAAPTTTAVASAAEQLPGGSSHADASLPATGSGSDALLALGLKVLAGGIGMVLLARRCR